MEEYRRPCRWKDNIKMDLKHTDVNVMNWMEASQDRAHWIAPENECIIKENDLEEGNRTVLMCILNGCEWDEPDGLNSVF